jgi:ABC-type phosphate transport system auxiliary subunit
MEVVMEIREEIKDTTRKVTNSVVDAAEGVVGMIKSPKELAKRVVEHLNHKEYTKIAEIITEEAKKYVAKMGLDDVSIINKKLEDFENKMSDLAEDFEDANYQQIATKINELESSIPEGEGAVSEVFKNIKRCLKKMVGALEEQAKEVGKEGVKKEVDFSKLQSVFEEYFNKITPK